MASCNINEVTPKGDDFSEIETNISVDRLAQFEQLIAQYPRLILETTSRSVIVKGPRADALSALQQWRKQ
jgi:hypothetical protein